MASLKVYLSLVKQNDWARANGATHKERAVTTWWKDQYLPSSAGSSVSQNTARESVVEWEAGWEREREDKTEGILLERLYGKNVKKCFYYILTAMPVMVKTVFIFYLNVKHIDTHSTMLN